jgi:exoribonuclease-2
LELEARARTRTLYWPFGAAPMFPKALAEGPFSLTPAAGDGVCDALSICVTLTDEGGLEQLVQVTPSRIRVTHQLTYDEADADLALGPDMCEHPDLQLLCEASRLR